MDKKIIGTKIFRCACPRSWHAVRISREFGNDYITVTVITSRSDSGFLKRLKLAISILFGNEHVLSEIFIHPDEEDNFASFVSELNKNANH